MENTLALTNLRLVGSVHQHYHHTVYLNALFTKPSVALYLPCLVNDALINISIASVFEAKAVIAYKEIQ